MGASPDTSTSAYLAPGSHTEDRDTKQEDKPEQFEDKMRLIIVTVRISFFLSFFLKKYPDYTHMPKNTRG